MKKKFSLTDLKEHRFPTEEEKEQIIRWSKKNLKRSHKHTDSVTTILFIAAIILLLGSITTESAGGKILIIIFSIILFIIAFSGTNSENKGTNENEDFLNGNVMVISGKIDKVEGIDLPGTRKAYFITDNGIIPPYPYYGPHRVQYDPSLKNGTRALLVFSTTSKHSIRQYENTHLLTEFMLLDGEANK